MSNTDSKLRRMSKLYNLFQCFGRYYGTYVSNILHNNFRTVDNFLQSRNQAKKFKTKQKNLICLIHTSHLQREISVLSAYPIGRYCCNTVTFFQLQKLENFGITAMITLGYHNSVTMQIPHKVWNFEVLRLQSTVDKQVSCPCYKSRKLHGYRTACSIIVD